MYYAPPFQIALPALPLQIGGRRRTMYLQTQGTRQEISFKVGALTEIWRCLLHTTHSQG